MNMLTKVELISDGVGRGLVRNINDEIESKRENGWYLRGTPVVLDENRVLLTFEKPEPEERSSIREMFTD